VTSSGVSGRIDDRVKKSDSAEKRATIVAKRQNENAVAPMSIRDLDVFEILLSKLLPALFLLLSFTLKLTIIILIYLIYLQLKLIVFNFNLS